MRAIILKRVSSLEITFWKKGDIVDGEPAANGQLDVQLPRDPVTGRGGGSFSINPGYWRALDAAQDVKAPLKSS